MSSSINFKRQAGCAFACPRRRSPGDDEPCAPIRPVGPHPRSFDERGSERGRQVKERAWRMEGMSAAARHTRCSLPLLLCAGSVSVPPRSSLPLRVVDCPCSLVFRRGERTPAKLSSVCVAAVRSGVCVCVWVHFHACPDFLPRGCLDRRLGARPGTIT